MVELPAPLGDPYADGPDAYQPESYLELSGSFTLEECDAQAALARALTGRYQPPIRRFPPPAPEEVRRAS